MAVKPVKVLTDLLTKKQIIKQDADGNILFNVSGTLGEGHVSSSLPITSSYFVGSGKYLTDITASNGNLPIYTSGNISGSGLEANPVYLKDPLIIGTITSSYIYSPQITGNLYGTASYAENAGNITQTGIADAYKRLRYQETGNFDLGGGATIMLPSSSLGGNAFPIESFNYINVVVTIKEEERWVNDLLSVQMYTSSTNVYIELSAPSLTNTDKYKILAVNENPDDYVL